MLVVVERLPETDPDVEQAQAAAQTTEEAIGHYRAKHRKRQRQVVVSPLRCQGKMMSSTPATALIRQ